MPPHTLISLAFQLVLSTTDKGLQRAPSVAKIRKLASDDGIRAAIEKLYCTDGNGSAMSRILYSVDQWLTNYDEIPKVLRTTIARKSPEVYLLLMAFAKWKEENQVETTTGEETLFRATAYYLHWMVGDKFDVANSIYKAVAKSEFSKWGDIIKQELLKSCVNGTIIPLLPPEAFRGLFTLEGEKPGDLMEMGAATCRGGRCGRPFRTTKKCYSTHNGNICARDFLITTRHGKIYGKIKQTLGFRPYL